MRVETGAILISAGVTSAVALLGVAVIAVAAREHPTRAAWGAPAVVVAALAAGVVLVPRNRRYRRLALAEVADADADGVPDKFAG